MEREVGGGIGMGNTCKPLAVSFQCMTKSTTNKKNKKKKEMSAQRTGEWGPKKEGNFKSRHSVWKGMKMWKDTRGERRTGEYSVTGMGSAR